MFAVLRAPRQSPSSNLRIHKSHVLSLIFCDKRAAISHTIPRFLLQAEHGRGISSVGQWLEREFDTTMARAEAMQIVLHKTRLVLRGYLFRTHRYEFPI